MIKTIDPNQFKTIAWKNGHGETTELAINFGGTLEKFDWRLSIACVIENGLFSDFSGYYRQLILLKGQGIKLTHNEQQKDELTVPLAVAAFEGSNQTFGELINGPIKGFNVMTKQSHFNADVKTFSQQQTITCSIAKITFIYAVKQPIMIEINQECIELPHGHLFQAANETSQFLNVTGKDFIVVKIQPQ